MRYDRACQPDWEACLTLLKEEPHFRYGAAHPVRWRGKSGANAKGGFGDEVGEQPGRLRAEEKRRKRPCALQREGRSRLASYMIEVVWHGADGKIHITSPG